MLVTSRYQTPAMYNHTGHQGTLLWFAPSPSPAVPRPIPRPAPTEATVAQPPSSGKLDSGLSCQLAPHLPRLVCSCPVQNSSKQTDEFRPYLFPDIVRALNAPKGLHCLDQPQLGPPPTAPAHHPGALFKLSPRAPTPCLGWRCLCL